MTYPLDVIPAVCVSDQDNNNRAVQLSKQLGTSGE